MEYDIKLNGNLDRAARELIERVKKGEAFLIWSTGMGKKQQKKLEKQAYAALSKKKDYVSLHVIKADCGNEFMFIE